MSLSSASLRSHSPASHTHTHSRLLSGTLGHPPLRGPKLLETRIVTVAPLLKTLQDALCLLQEKPSALKI